MVRILKDQKGNLQLWMVSALLLIVAIGGLILNQLRVLNSIRKNQIQLNRCADEMTKEFLAVQNFIYGKNIQIRKIRQKQGSSDFIEQRALAELSFQQDQELARWRDRIRNWKGIPDCEVSHLKLKSIPFTYWYRPAADLLGIQELHWKAGEPASVKTIVYNGKQWAAIILKGDPSGNWSRHWTCQ